MGVLRSTQSLQAEVEEMRAALLLPGGAAAGWKPSGGDAGGEEGAAGPRTVCVTGGISFVGFAIVDRLLRQGYTVRLALETQGKSNTAGLPFSLSILPFLVVGFFVFLCISIRHHFFPIIF